jgi:hypothetical protein
VSPAFVAKGQTASFLVPLQRAQAGEESVTLTFRLDPAIDLRFSNNTPSLSAPHTIGPQCVFQVTPFSLVGTFAGATFVEVSLNGATVVAASFPLFVM